MRSYAVIPPLMLDAAQRRCVFYNENGALQDMEADFKVILNLKHIMSQSKFLYFQILRCFFIRFCFVNKFFFSNSASCTLWGGLVFKYWSNQNRESFLNVRNCSEETSHLDTILGMRCLFRATSDRQRMR